MPAVVRMMPPVSMPVPMAPIPRTIPIIPVVPRSHDDGRGIHHGRRWGDDHGGRGDHNRQPHPHGDVDPTCLGRERRGKTSATSRSFCLVVVTRFGSRPSQTEAENLSDDFNVTLH